MKDRLQGQILELVISIAPEVIATPGPVCKVTRGGRPRAWRISGLWGSTPPTIRATTA
jgi:hypothetical protein